MAWSALFWNTAGHTHLILARDMEWRWSPLPLLAAIKCHRTPLPSHELQSLQREWTSRFSVIMGVRWTVCSCISRYILLWCHIVSTPANALFMSLNSKTKWKGKGRLWGRRQWKPQNPRLHYVSCFIRLFAASDSTRPELYLSLFVTLTVPLSKFFLFFHYVFPCHIVAETHSDARQLVSDASERICVAFFLFGSGSRRLRRSWLRRCPQRRPLTPK